MIDLGENEFGVLLPVRAQPGSKRNEIRGAHNGSLKVCVTQVAEKGKANQAILKLLCKSLNLRGSHIELVSGDLSSDKRFLIREITLEQLRERIELIVNST